jgi:hypothetical protein
MGDNKISYETTSHKKEHSQRIADPSPSPDRSIEKAKAELTRHHFDFGHESPAPVTTHQRTFAKNMYSEAQTLKNSRTFLDKINIGEGVSPALHSTTQAEFKETKFTRDPKEENVLYQKLQKVSIKYGEHIPVYESANRKYGTLRNNKPAFKTTSNIHGPNDDIKQRLKQSYVSIGDEALQSAFFSST